MLDPTTGDFRKDSFVTDDKINGAIYAVFAKPETGPSSIGGGYLLNFAAEIEAHEPSTKALADPEAKPGWRGRSRDDGMDDDRPSTRSKRCRQSANADPER